MRLLYIITKFLHLLHKPVTALQLWFGTILIRVLDTREKETLALLLYDKGREYRGKGLYAWEMKWFKDCLLYTSPSPRDQRGSRMPSSA